MKVISEIKRRKIPIVRMEKSLNKYDDKVLFPEKLKMANEMLTKVGLPKTSSIGDHFSGQQASEPTVKYNKSNL